VEIVATVISAGSLAGSVVWAAWYLGKEIGRMGAKLEAHATAVSSIEQQFGRLDARLREVERNVIGKKGA
jgi:hypothetical protein